MPVWVSSISGGVKWYSKGCKFEDIFSVVVSSCIATLWPFSLWCGVPQTRIHWPGSILRFHVKPVFSSPLLLLPVPGTDSFQSVWSYRQNHSLVKSWENQGRTAATRAHIFGTVYVLSWITESVISKYEFKNEQELVTELFLLYVLQVGLLNGLLLLWWFVTCTHTKPPQGQVQIHPNNLPNPFRTPLY